MSSSVISVSDSSRSEEELRKHLMSQDAKIAELERMLRESKLGKSKPLFKKHGTIEHHEKYNAPGQCDIRIRSSAGTIAMRNLLMPTVTVDVAQSTFDAKSFNVYSMSLSSAEHKLKLLAVGCALNGRKFELLLFDDNKELIDPQGMPCFQRNSKWQANGVTWLRTAINLERMSPTEIRTQFYQDIDHCIEIQKQQNSGSTTPSIMYEGSTTPSESQDE